MRNILGIVVLILVLGAAVIFVNQSDIGQENPQTAPREVTSQTVDTSNLPQDCDGTVIPALTEGPYYTPDTPERQDIREENTVGEPLILEGYVFDTDCKPVAGAWIDFWQADGEGNYDNESYNLRGHQFTDEKGYYRLVTVLPTRYTGRTEHIHFKIRASEQSETITSQLFFPNSETNETDSIFNEQLIVTMSEKEGDTHRAYNNFVINR